MDRVFPEKFGPIDDPNRPLLEAEMSHDTIKQGAGESPHEPCRSQTCSPTELVETTPSPRRRREGGPDPHLLLIGCGHRAGARTQSPRLCTRVQRRRPRPMLQNAGSDPAIPWTSCLGPTSGRPCVPTRGTWSPGCSPHGSSCRVT